MAGIKILILTLLSLISCKSTSPQQSQVLDKGTSSTGQTVFVWPKNVGNRDYDKLAEQMTQYATLTGNCYNQTANGAGETQFKSELESRRKTVRNAFKSGGIERGCASYKENFIDKTYNGSPFAQYGYCNESSYTALCLATQAGFKPNEILKCVTMALGNDHTFTLLERPGQKWCMMDRYDLIDKGNFFCNVYWDEPTKLIFVDHSAANHRWYQGVMCYPLDRWLKTL